VTIATPSHPDILILGAGWTSNFLIPLLEKEKVTYAATTTTGHDRTLTYKFEFDEKTHDLTHESRKQLSSLPSARTVLITFPLRGTGLSKALLDAYTSSHELPSSAKGFNFIQLGSSGIFTPGDPTVQSTWWITRHSKYDASNPRAIAEDELLKLGGCVLNLSGLWGGQRQAKHWIDRVAATKEQLKSKTSLHMIHGKDVAVGILGVHRKFDKARGERFVS
jgi:hypothetical protein